MRQDRSKPLTLAGAALLGVGACVVVAAAVADQELLALLGALLLFAALTCVILARTSAGTRTVVPPFATPAAGVPILPGSSLAPIPMADVDGQPERQMEVPLFERLSDPVLLVDEAGVVSRASSSTERVLGHEPLAVSGQHLTSFLHEDDVAAAKDFILDVAAGGETLPHRAGGCAAWTAS